jgi:7-cyano-7-deazaguanine synthase
MPPAASFKTQNPATLVVCSGGLDSVTLAYKVVQEGHLAGLVSFNYGQRHVRELDYARQAAAALGAPHKIIDISAVGAALTGSALTDDVEVPDGHYAQETMKLTIVPNRNAIMLAIAYGMAASRGASRVAAALHAGDHFIYPDCRPAFTQAFESMERAALEGTAEITLFTPFLTCSKADIAREAARLNVPVERTWSCYKGGDIHCGRCGTCVERREAFALAGLSDPTPYADPEYWHYALAAYKKGAA